jgi:hypothetical protein
MRKPSLRVSCLWLNGAKERGRRSEHLVLKHPAGWFQAYRGTISRKRGVLPARWSIPNFLVNGAMLATCR